MATDMTMTFKKSNDIKKKRNQYAREVKKMADKANKRLRLLEKNNLTNMPAYKSVLASGDPQFSVAGKNYNELQSEYWRIKRFLDAETSTIKGVRQYFTNISQALNIQLSKNIQSNNIQLMNFFGVVDKLKEYYRNMKEIALSLDYMKLIQAVNQYVNMQGNSLESLDDDFDSLLESIEKLTMVGVADNMMDNIFNDL